MEEGVLVFCPFVLVSTSLFAEAKLQHGAHRIELWIIHREHTLLELACAVVARGWLTLRPSSTSPISWT